MIKLNLGLVTSHKSLVIRRRTQGPSDEAIPMQSRRRRGKLWTETAPRESHVLGRISDIRYRTYRVRCGGHQAGVFTCQRAPLGAGSRHTTIRLSIGSGDWPVKRKVRGNAEF